MDSQQVSVTKVLTCANCHRNVEVDLAVLNLLFEHLGDCTKIWELVEFCSSFEPETLLHFS